MCTTSVHPRSSKAQLRHRIAASVAYPFPHTSRLNAHPISLPGQPGGNHAPALPTHRPVAFSITEKLLYPWTLHAPAKRHKFRHAPAASRGPPINRVTSASERKAVQAEQSDALGGLRRRRSVSNMFCLTVVVEGQRILSGKDRSMTVSVDHRHCMPRLGQGVAGATLTSERALSDFVTDERQHIRSSKPQINGNYVGAKPTYACGDVNVR